MKKNKMVALLAMVLCACLVNGQNVVRSIGSSNSSNQSSNSTATTFEPKKFYYGMYIGYTSANTSGAYSSDLTSGARLGMDLSFGKTLLFNTGFDIDFFFGDNSFSNVDFPIRIGYQHGWINSNGNDTYIRLMAGPVIDLYNLSNSCKFNLKLGAKLELSIARFNFFAETGWGILNMGTSRYKLHVNTPIAVGIGYVL